MQVVVLVKKAFLLLCAVLLVLGCVLPLCGYRLARAALARAGSAGQADSGSEASGSEAGLGGLLAGSASSAPLTVEDADVFLVEDESTGEVRQVARRDYLIGAVAAEMPISWPDEALKAQAVAAHSYALYCRDNSPKASGAWISADPARRQGYLTAEVLRSYWGTDYEANYARLSALVAEVETKVLCYGGAPAAASYFAISNGRTEASENVWSASLPYLISVESLTDASAPNYEYTVSFTPEQVSAALAGQLGITANLSASESWFGAAALTEAGYVAAIDVCGQSVTGPELRSALGLRSACFEVQYSAGSFNITTKGYGHGVGLSQWGAKALAGQGSTYAEILAHYFPGTYLAG